MATAREYAEWLVRNADKRGSPEFDAVAKAYQRVRVSLPPMNADPAEGMSGAEKFLAGAGKAITDVGRGIGQMVGAVSRDDVAEARRRDAALMNTGAGMAGNVLGNVAMLAPAAAIPGANTIVGGASIGALSGLLQPSVSTDETLGNTALGGAFGAAIPVASRVWSASRAAAEPFYQAGRDQIVGRAIKRAAGSDAPAVAQRFKDASAPFVGPSTPGRARATMGEIVPGSVPTAAEVADNAGVAAMYRAAAANSPEVTNAARGIAESNNAARVALLEDIAGAGGKREFFEAARDATAEQLYGYARRVGIDPAKLTPEALENIATMAKRIPDSVMNKARELAKMSGEEMTDATSLQGLHWVKKGLDSMIETAKRSGDNTSARVLTNLQSDLLKGIDRLSPAYETARKTFADMSKPVNSMETGQQILDASRNKLTQTIEPGAFARSLTDNSARKATGFQGATLENTVNNADLNALQAILEDLRRVNFASTAGRGSGSDTVQKLAYTNMLDEAGVPSFIRSLRPVDFIGGVASRVADAGYGRANRELQQQLAEVLLDPARAAALMERASPQARNAIMALLPRSAQGVMLSIPASANAK